MKKISLSILFLLFGIMHIYAQAVTASVTTSPCNGNGVLTVNFTGFTGSKTITYDYLYLPDVVHVTTAALVDSLVGYTGNTCTVTVVDNLNNVSSAYITTTTFQSNLLAYVTNDYVSNCGSMGQIVGCVNLGLTNPALLQWYNAANHSLLSSNMVYPNNWSNCDTISLPVGQYYVKVLDTIGTGCVSYSDSNTGLIASNNCFQASTTVVQPACTNGSITVDSILNATPPYTYLWSNGSTASSISGLSQGYYTLKIYDATGDSSFSYYYLVQNPQLTINTTQTPASCTNGSIAISSITNATAPISYLWSNGSIASNITGLSTGSYTVGVIDANGCKGSKGFFVNQIPILTINTVGTPATCLQANGATTAFAAGGTAPYSYLWGNGTVGNVLTSVAGGNYSVYVTDANGCIGTGYANVSITSPINVNYTSTLSSCTAPTGTATVNMFGGTAPYTTTWSTFPAQSGVTASALAPGFYPFHITDAVGCVKNGSVQIFDLSANMSISLAKTQYVCGVINGAYTASIYGGTAPFSYLWGTGSTSNTINNLQPGSYFLEITDANSCVKYISDYMNYSSNINIAITPTNASCVFNNDGSAIAVSNGGAAPYNYNWNNNVSNTSAATSLLYGGYYVNVTDANGCYMGKYVYVGYDASNTSCYCTLQGYAYVDANGNCIKDPTEFAVPNSAITNTIGGTRYTNANGFYSMIVPSGTSTLSQIINPNYPLQTCQNNAIVINAVASAGCVITNDFADSVLPKTDMQSYIISISPPRPGFFNQEKLVTVNNGTQLESAVVSHFGDDGQVGAPTFANGLYSGSGNRYTNTTPFSMLPSSSINEILQYYTPTNTPLGTLLDLRDSVCHAAPITDWVNDETPWNNVNINVRTVVGSYDPNNKIVSPAGKGALGEITANDSVLTYTVQFQNEGTYYAQNVVVLDSLSSNLDWATLKPIYASHPCEVSINKNGVLKYDFKNIILPTKTDEPILSNGHFIYSIKPKKNWAIGATITNSAAIYFDFNEPIITNSVKNTKVTPAAIGNAIKNNSLAIYPVPADNELNIAFDVKTGKVEILIYDMVGKLVLQTNVDASAKNKINISALTAGQYIIKANHGNNSFRNSFIKK
jgi:uncharacterized repeat protein (TIGR01451 family)